MNGHDERRLLTAQEAAEYLRVSLAILQRIKDDLEPPTGGGRKMTLQEWLAEIKQFQERQTQT